MTDFPPVEGASAAPLSEAPTNPLAAFDSVVLPFVERLGVGIVTEAHLKGFANVLRNGLLAMLVPQPPQGEPHDVYAEQVAAQKAARMNANTGPGPNDPDYVAPVTAVPEEPADTFAPSDFPAPAPSSPLLEETTPLPPGAPPVETVPTPAAPREGVVTTGPLQGDVEPPIA